MMKRTMPIAIVDKEDQQATSFFWLQKSPEERLSAVEFLREQFYSIQGYTSLPRMVFSITLRGRKP